MNTTRTTAQITALCAAVTMTALLVGSQLGLASHYTGEAALQLAHQATPQPVQTAAGTARTPG